MNSRKNVKNNPNVALTKAHDACIDALVAFRRAHLGIIHTYVVQPQKSQSEEQAINNAHGELGSGGTPPVKFAQLVIQDTLQAKSPAKISPRWFVVLAVFVGLVLWSLA